MKDDRITGDPSDTQLHTLSDDARCTTGARIEREDLILISGSSRRLTIPEKTLRTN
jgi:hypothetical protein